jgi:hypothetical protein
VTTVAAFLRVELCFIFGSLLLMVGLRGGSFVVSDGITKSKILPRPTISPRSTFMKPTESWIALSDVHDQSQALEDSTCDPLRGPEPEATPVSVSTAPEDTLDILIAE